MTAVRRGVRVGIMRTDLESRTINDFGEQWLAFRDNPAYYGSTEMLADIFGPLLAISTVAGMRVADIGSGTGRIVNMLLDAGAAHVVAVEPSDAFLILQENTAARRDQVTYVRAAGENLPAGLDLDLVVSIGVLHHISDPTPIVAAAYQALRPGGQFLAWLYGREGNEAYLRVAGPLRRVTTHLPHALLVGLCRVLALVLDAYIAACRWLPLPMRSYMRGVLAKLSRPVRRLVIYDQLNPAYARYYRRYEAERLLADQGFVEVTTYHRHGYSWSIIGRKPPTNS
jgi:SAM-dependent methyltransferase